MDTSENEAKTVKGAAKLIRDDCKNLAKMYTANKHIFNVLKEIIEAWLNDGNLAEELYENIALVLGKNIARLMINALAAPVLVQAKVIELCEDVDANTAFELRRLIALFRNKVMAKLYPHRIIKMKITYVDELPPILRMEALTFNGDKVVLDLDRNDIERIVEVAMKYKIIGKQSDEDDVDECETMLDNQSITKNNRMNTKSNIINDTLNQGITLFM